MKRSGANFNKACCNRLAKHKGASTVRKDGNQNTGGKHHEEIRFEQHHERSVADIPQGRPVSFAIALRMAWANAKAHNAAKAEAGISEETHTWAGWRDLGYEVIHESKALYRAILNDPATKNGTRVTCYFGASQVQPISA